jgi:hypothetical protein
VKCSFNGNTCKSSVTISIEEKYVDVYCTAAHRNEWNGYNQETAWEVTEEQWRCATDTRDFEPDEPISDEEENRTFFDGLDVGD